MKIHILALDGVFDTGLATLMDAFGTANELAEMTGLTGLRFELSVVGVRRAVKTSQGLTVPVVPVPREEVPDWAVVPAIGFKMPGPLQAALARRDVADLAGVLRGYAEQGADIAAACIGTFVLAESGLLDQHDATTTWWLAPLFRQRYPQVRLDEAKMIVKSEKIITAGAALSHMDLALWIIRQQSPRLAGLTAKYLVVDSRPSQSAYILVDHLAHTDPLVESFERWARGELAQGFSLEHAAAATATSKRTLARRMHEVLGKSPLAYFQDLRVERAVHLLKTTDQSVDQIAAQVGYADGVTLRALLHRRLGHGVREIRRNPA
jgi:transcriptional regulator GlxA family with amidase domain